MKLEHFTDYVLTSDNKEVQNAVAIQRKTIGEVLSTKKDKKTGKKVSMMKEITNRISELSAYGVPWLLIEDQGMFINTSGAIMTKRGGALLQESGITSQSYYNFLHSIQRTGTYIQKTYNWEQSIWWFYALHKYIQKQHFPKLNRTYTKEEEIMGALQTIPNVGLEKAQQIYGAYKILNVTNALNMITNTSTQNILTLKVFDKLLTTVKSILREKRFSKNVLIGQLKTRIIKNEALLNAFISILIEEGYLQKEQKGKYVYYSLLHTNASLHKKVEKKEEEQQEEKKKEFEKDTKRWREYEKKKVEEHKK